MTRFFTFVFGILLGTLIGAVAALLSTPYSGMEIRNRLMEKSKELRKTADAKLEQGQNVVQERLTTFNERIARGLEVSSKVLLDAAERMRRARSEEVVEDISQ